MRRSLIVFIAVILLALASQPTLKGEISRQHVMKTGPTERLVENPPLDIANRSEALIDAIWARDFEAFTEAAISPETGTSTFTEKKFKKLIQEFGVFYRGDLRTMRHPPKWPTPTADNIWVRMSVQRLNSTQVRGQFILVFGGADWGLKHVTLNRYEHADLPSPDPEIPADIIRDRPAS